MRVLTVTGVRLPECHSALQWEKWSKLYVCVGLRPVEGLESP